MNDPSLNQKEFWKSNFGEDYIKRHMEIQQKDAPVVKLTGVSTQFVMEEFLKNLDKDMKILEVGCNTGLSLTVLKNLGFKNLYGLEINSNAIKIAQKNLPSAKFFNSSIEEFICDEKFDLVFTTWVLIHINPIVLDSVLKKIVDLSRKYVFGYEYFSEKLIMIPYRGTTNTMWKENFCQHYKTLYPSFELVKIKKIPYLESELVDEAFLLKKN